MARPLARKGRSSRQRPPSREVDGQRAAAGKPPAARARPGGGGLKLPIALKFAASIAILVVAAMSWQGLTALREASGYLEAEINAQGISDVNAVVRLVHPQWLESVDHRADLSEFLDSYAGTRSGGRIYDIVVSNPELGGILASARGGIRAEGQVRTAATAIESESARRRSVEVSELEVEGVPVRSFSLDTTSVLGTAEPGRVEVLLSAEHIRQSRSRLKRAMTQTSVVSTVAALVASFLLASLLTRPIRTLVRDMKQVSHGNLQHESRVNSGDELGDLARAFNVMTGSLQQAHDAKLVQRSLEHELQLANSIQSGLLPSDVPELAELDIAAYYASAKEVGGDYYDFIPIDEKRWAAVVADVSGKGVPASLVMTMTRSLLRLASQGELQPTRSLTEVNTCLSADMKPGMFVTMVYLLIDPDTREVLFCRAGHNAPILYRKQRKQLLRLSSKGIAIGLDRHGAMFESHLEVMRFPLGPGDVLVLYTDGIVEAKDTSDADYGDERLDQLVATRVDLSAQEIVDSIVEDVSDHTRGAEPSDDITVVVLKGR